MVSQLRLQLLLHLRVLRVQILGLRVVLGVPRLLNEVGLIPCVSVQTRRRSVGSGKPRLEVAQVVEGRSLRLLGTRQVLLKLWVQRRLLAVYRVALGIRTRHNVVARAPRSRLVDPLRGRLGLGRPLGIGAVQKPSIPTTEASGERAYPETREAGS